MDSAIYGLVDISVSSINCITNSQRKKLGRVPGSQRKSSEKKSEFMEVETSFRFIFKNDVLIIIEYKNNVLLITEYTTKII